MKMKYKDGLLYTDLEVSYRGKSMVVQDIIIDTGAVHSIISPDAVIDLDINASIEDDFVTTYGIGGEHYAYRKIIDGIVLGVFESISELQRQSESLFGTILLSGNISQTCNGGKDKYKGFSFMFVSEIEDLITDEIS